MRHGGVHQEERPDVKHSPIVVTGLGMVSALGWSAEEAWSAIEEERSGLTELTLFDSPRCGHFPVGQIREDPALRSALATGSRTDHLAACAASTAFHNAGLNRLSLKERQDIGLVLGASTGGMLDSESFLLGLIREQQVRARKLARHDCAHATNAVARLLGISGFRATVSVACSSGALAIGMACDALCTGEAAIMLAGGVDCLTRLTLNGFASLLITSPDGCHPFDANRNGMSLGEGAAVLVLETEEKAKSRGAPVLAYLEGWASTCDAYHVTAPSRDGAGMYRAMALALERACVHPSEVRYINAHGTGTIDNDMAEARAITRLFGKQPPFVSSTKRFFGHTLAASGAMEAVVCILAMRNKRVPQNLGLRQLDPDIAFEPVREMIDAELGVVLSNSLGFGGSCASLVIRCAGG